MGTTVINEGHLVLEQLRTLREWVSVYPYREVFKANESERKAPHMRDPIAAPDEVHDLRRFNTVGCGTMHLALLSMYSEMGMGTINDSPHAFAMCYLVLGLKHQKRLSGTWATIGAVSGRFRKDIFISENIPSTISDTVKRMRLPSGAPLVHVSAMKRVQFTGRKVPAINNVSITRTWDIECGPIIRILRRYLSDK